MKLIFNDIKKIEKGNFNAMTALTGLVLPKEMEPLTQQLGANTAESFFSLAADLPTAVMAHCQWTLEETKAATEKLRTQLRGFVSDDVLDFSPPKEKFTFGALRPPKPPRP